MDATVASPGRLLMQKAFHEQECRQRLVASREALTAELMAEFRLLAALEECSKAIAAKRERVRVDEAALRAAGIVFNGAYDDLVASIAERVTSPAVTDEQAHTILKASV
jgi:shikimate kinase